MVLWRGMNSSFVKPMLFFLLVLFAGIIARTVQVALSDSVFFEHAFCIQYYKPLLYWLVSADLRIWLSYVAIPFFIFWHRKRDDIPRPLAYCAMAFIVLCGSGHFIKAVTYFVPIYWIEAVFDELTADVSILTVFALWRYRDWFSTSQTRAELEAKLLPIIEESQAELSAARNNGLSYEGVEKSAARLEALKETLTEGA